MGSRAGLRQHDERHWTREAVIAAIREFAEREGRPPSANDWRRSGDGHPATSTVIYECGSWRAALIEAGVVDRSHYHPSLYDPSIIDEAAQLYREGASIRLVARRLDMSEDTISCYLDSAGVERRSPVEAARLRREREAAA